MSYQDILALRGRKPLVIERTVKLPGHIILNNATRPIERVSYGKEKR